MSDDRLPSWVFQPVSAEQRVPGPTREEILAWEALSEAEKREVWAKDREVGWRHTVANPEAWAMQGRALYVASTALHGRSFVHAMAEHVESRGVVPPPEQRFSPSERFDSFGVTQAVRMLEAMALECFLKGLVVAHSRGRAGVPQLFSKNALNRAWLSHKLEKFAGWASPPLVLSTEELRVVADYGEWVHRGRYPVGRSADTFSRVSGAGWPDPHAGPRKSLWTKVTEAVAVTVRGSSTG